MLLLVLGGLNLSEFFVSGGMCRVVCAGWLPPGSTVRARPVASLAIEKACPYLIPGEEQILQRNLISGLVCCC